MSRTTPNTEADLPGRSLLGRRAALRLLAAGLAATASPSAGTATASPTLLAATPIARLDLAWWRARHAAVLARLRQGHVDLIFLGDSITQNWERAGPPDYLDYRPVWDRFYGGRNAVNLGFVGDTTANLLWRMQNGELDAITPRAAVVLIGANNLGRVHWSAADTLAGIAAVLQTLRQRLPATRVLLLGVLPSDRSAWVDETTAAINAGLAARYGQGDQPVYLDVSPVFLRQGRLDHGLFYDPRMTPPRPALHPTAEGMARMAAMMEPRLAALLGDRPRV